MGFVQLRNVSFELMPTVWLAGVGETFVNGLSSSYDDTFPEELKGVLIEEEFSSAMTKINEALLDHWPCLPCEGFAYGCCICTLGASILCSVNMVKEAEERCRLQIRRINNQDNMKQKEITFVLVRKWCPWPSSHVEVNYTHPTTVVI